MTSYTTRIDAYEPNLIINGNMDFAQRVPNGNTLAVTTGTNKVVCDRFRFFTVGNTVTVSQDTFVPIQAQTNWQSRYSMKFVSTGGAAQGTTNFASVAYLMEGQDYQQIHNRKARLQFMAYSSIAGQYSVAIQNAAQNRSYTASYTLTANTWTKVAIDIPFDSSGTWNFDNNLGAYIWFSLSMGSNFTSAPGVWGGTSFLGATGQTDWAVNAGATFYLSQVMLVPQDLSSAGTNVDLNFRRRGASIGHELSMCQRYYEKSFDISTMPANGGNSTTILDATNATLIPVMETNANQSGIAIIKFTIPKRSSPSSVTIFGNSTSQPSGNAAGVATNFSSSYANLDAFNTTGFQVHQGQTNAPVYNIKFHWAADSEM